MLRREPDVCRCVHGGVRGEEEKLSTLSAVWEGDVGHHVGGTQGFQLVKRQDYVTRNVTIKLRSRESEPENQWDISGEATEIPVIGELRLQLIMDMCTGPGIVSDLGWNRAP